MAVSHDISRARDFQPVNTYTGLAGSVPMTLADLYEEMPCYWFADPRCDTEPGTRYVYFLYCETANAVKVGIAGKPHHRVFDLQGGNPFPMEMAALIQTKPATKEAVELERWIHEAFSPWRIHREWFRVSPEVGEFIDYCRELSR